MYEVGREGGGGLTWRETRLSSAGEDWVVMGKHADAPTKLLK